MNTKSIYLLRNPEKLIPALMGASIFFITAVAFASIGVFTTFTTASSVQVHATTLTISKPTTTPGDLMIAAIAIHGGSAATTTAPSGWTLIKRTDNDANLALISYYKIAGASEAVSDQWVVEGQTTAEGGITKYSGVEITNPIDVSGGNFGLGLTATTPGVTTTAGNEEVIAIFAVDEGKTTTPSGAYFSSATGMNEKYEVSNTPFGPTLSFQEVAQTLAGTSTKTSMIGGNNKAKNWVAQQIALREQPAAPIAVVASGVSNGGNNFGQSGSFSLNCNAGTLLVVSMAGYASSTISSLIYNGVPLTKAARYKDSIYTSHADIWYLKNPSSGSNTLSWAWNTATYDLSTVGWMCTTGEATNPIGPNTNGASGGGNNVPLTAPLTTTADNSLIYASGWEGGGDQSGMAASGTNSTLSFAFQNTSVETAMGVYQAAGTAGTYTSGAVWPSNNSGAMAWIEILHQ